MNLSINGESQVPPGFRFHPTEEELLHYYLRKKMTSQKIELDVISEVDLNKLEPWDIQEKCKIGCTPQNDWYFFSHKDKKYPTGTRTNRATAAGFWKATGRDKFIYSDLRRIGLRKTLVFYKGRAPHGLKSDWIMHEYRLDEGSNDPTTIVSNSTGESCGEDDGWVVCRVFKKKNYLKTVETPNSTPNASSNFYVDSDLHHHQLLGSRNDGVLDQMLMYMGSSSSTCKLENINESVMTFSDRFMRLPRLDSPTPTSTTDLNNTGITNSSFNQDPVGLFKTNYYEQTTSFDDILNIPSSNGQLHEDDTVLLLDNDHNHNHNHSQNSSRVNDWFALDRLVASQLIGSNTTDQEENDKSKQLSFFGDPNNMTSFCSSPRHQDDNDTQLSYQYIRTSSEGRSHSNQTSTHHDEVYGTSDNGRLWDFN